MNAVITAVVSMSFRESQVIPGYSQDDTRLTGRKGDDDLGV